MQLIDEQKFKQLDAEYIDLKRKLKDFEEYNREFILIRNAREDEMLHHYILNR